MSQELRCGRCGTSNPPQASFCSGCGGALAPGPAPQPGPQPQPQPQPGPYGPQPGPQPYGPAPYGPQPYAPYGPQPGPHPQQASGGRATLALILGIAALFCLGPLTGIPAAFLGKSEMDAIQAGRSPAAGMGMARWGFYLGIAGSILGVIGCVLAAFLGMLPMLGGAW